VTPSRPFMSSTIFPPPFMEKGLLQELWPVLMHLRVKESSFLVALLPPPILPLDERAQSLLILLGCPPRTCFPPLRARLFNFRLRFPSPTISLFFARVGPHFPSPPSLSLSPFSPLLVRSSAFVCFSPSKPLWRLVLKEVHSPSSPRRSSSPHSFPVLRDVLEDRLGLQSLLRYGALFKVIACVASLLCSA